ncbi:hypothetical protein FQR65_LT19223 [Abscondita terminalis]|nr:hypothetical protein FQR65_LT19223 [Abscondita terminalis]
MRRIPVSDIEQRIKQAVAEQLGIKAEEIKNEASFMDDLGADSLDLVELVMSFENDFDITIPDEDSNEITTVQSAIDYVTKKLGIGKKNTAPAEPQAAPATPAEPSAQEVANKLLGLVKSLGLSIDGLSVSYNSQTDLATVRGQVHSQADKEKIVLAIGNVDHVAQVDDQMTVATPEPESKFYTVKSGDNLSKISKEFYGDPNQYNKIFEANRPLLKNADDIFPGQVLRIPA